ncbi:UDP-glucoronosyl and UDP-glucosyl transferase [Teladorsagia circumcincta]|uniref:UDP-glucuronosyltransferase n=1 Tax=Teladorsagia circumcincta TaxID=45464 RepID=A0A2G9UQQ3_TELCI|nr:UDP-glucoronosyl and UDP-glucosyl transferase [Teladorsagia circumcincta]
MESTDEMSFLERMKSFIGHSILPGMWKKMFADRETQIFRDLIDPNFPDLVDVAKTCPLVMVNSNELYELTRPTLAKVVSIGGVGIQIKDVKPLNKEFQQITDSCEGLVVFSFGSVTPSHRMPLAWKKAFLEAFSRFPKLNFVLRYEGTDLADQLPPNVYLFKWLPQADLLRHPKTVAFISHGGYNSLQEAVSSGVPMITVALFGDQPRNVKLAERHHFAINIRKGDISANAIAAALHKLLNDKSYSQNVKRLSQMVKKRPLLFNVRVAEALSTAGHNVTLALIAPQADRDNSDVKISDNIRVYRVNATIQFSRKEMEEKQAEFAFKKWILNNVVDLGDFGTEACTEDINSDVYNCGHMPSGSVMDYVAYLVGIPIIPSYVPPMMMEAAGEMNFVQRVKSVIGHGLMKFFWRRLIADPETELFRRMIRPDFPDLLNLASKCPLVRISEVFLATF